MTVPQHLSDVPVPSGEVVDRATEAAVTYCSPALMQHNHRSYLWSAALGLQRGLDVDLELLYVAAMLHDVGLVAAFDNVALPFEDAGGHAAWMFAAGAGWPEQRRARVAEVVVRHMWDEVDPALDVEGHLLEAGTAVDISGHGVDRLPESLRAEVLAAYPRLGLVDEFVACFKDQAARKPSSSAARMIAAGAEARIRANRLDADGSV